VTKNQPGYGNIIGIYIYICTYLRHEHQSCIGPLRETWWSSDLTWILVEVILCGFLSSQYMFIMVIKKPSQNHRVSILFHHDWMMTGGYYMASQTSISFFPTMVTTRTSHCEVFIGRSPSWELVPWKLIQPLCCSRADPYVGRIGSGSKSMITIWLGE